MSDNNTFEYKIKTSAELGAMKQTIDNQGQLINTLKAAGKDTSDLERNQKQLNQAFGEKYLELYKQHLQGMIAEAKKAGQPIGEMVQQLHALKAANQAPEAPGAFEKIGEALHEALNEIPGIGALTRVLNGSLGIVTAIAGAFEGAKKSVEEFAEAEVKVTELDAALAAQGQLTDEYREKLQALAKEQSEHTGRTDEEWLGVIGTLTKFGATSADIDEVTEATKNLAGFLGGDLQQAAFLVGKAMNGHYQMLQRYGIEVDKTKTQAEQLEQVFQQLAQRGGGQLEARTRTLAGEWRTLTVGVGDFFKGIGNVISRTGALQFVLYGLGKSLSWVNEIFPKTVEQVEEITNKSPQLISAVTQIQQRFKAAGDAASEMSDEATEAVGKKVDISGITKNIDELTDAYKKAADEADRLRKANDELRDAKTAKELAEVDLLEEKGKAKQPGGITSEEARKRRSAIRYGAETAKIDDEAFVNEKQRSQAASIQSQAQYDEEQARAKATAARDAYNEARTRAVQSGAMAIHESPNAALSRKSSELKEAENAVKEINANKAMGIVGAADADRKIKQIDDKIKDLLFDVLNLKGVVTSKREAADAEDIAKAAEINRKTIDAKQQPIIQASDVKARVLDYERQRLRLQNDKEAVEVNEGEQSKIKKAKLDAAKADEEKIKNDITSAELANHNTIALKKQLIDQQERIKEIEKGSPLTPEEKRGYDLQRIALNPKVNSNGNNDRASIQADLDAAMEGYRPNPGTVGRSAADAIRDRARGYNPDSAGSVEGLEQAVDALIRNGSGLNADVLNKLKALADKLEKHAREIKNLQLQFKNSTAR